MVDVTPHPKPATEGGIGRPKPKGRARTHRTSWARLHAAKGGDCRLSGPSCSEQYRYELHHLLSRARGGPDAAWNLVPLCPRHHELVTREDGPTLAALAASLTDGEYAGLIEHGGEGILQRLFRVG